MRNFRPIEIGQCDICGREFDKLELREMFTGRTKHICPECYRAGNSQLDAKRRDWRKTARGKAVIEHFEKNK